MTSEIDGPDFVGDLSWMFRPFPANNPDLGLQTPRVVATIGCPGSGKSTMSLSYDPSEWLVLTLDDWRSALWPPHRRVYWEVRGTKKGPQAQRVLHDVQTYAIRSGLRNGWNLFLADTHVNPKAFYEYVAEVRKANVLIEWKFLDVPKDVILERNQTRPVDQRLPDDILERIYNDLWKEDAWWRQIPSEQIEFIKDTSA